MTTLETDPQAAPDSAQEGWIPLGPAHLFPWLLFLAIFLESVVFVVAPNALSVRIAVGWGFTLLRWTLGGLAIGMALRAHSEKAPGSLRGTAFGLAAAALGLQIGLRFGLQFAGTSVYPLLVGFHALTAVMGGSSLILLSLGREEGAFDAAVAALALVAGAGWLGLPVLAIAAMKGHPLLAAQWQALREPRTTLEGGWFDGLDESLRLQNLGACALFCALAFLALAGRLGMTLTHGGAFGANLWWASFDIIALVLTSLLLAIHVLRRTSHREGRGPAIAALLVTGLPLLLLLVGLVILVLLLTDVIHFRLF